MGNNVQLEKFCYLSSTRIMRALGRMGIHANVDYAPVGLNSARVMALVLKGLGEDRLGDIYKAQRSLTYAAGLDDKSEIRVGFDKLGVILEIPKPRTLWAKVSVDQLASKGGWVASVGLDLQMQSVEIDYSSPSTGHTMMAGRSRSGKTVGQQVVMYTIAHNSSPEQTGLMLIDVAKKGKDPYEPWDRFANVAHMIHPIIVDVDEAVRALRWVELEKERRATLGVNTPRLFLFIDELRSLADNSVIMSILGRLSAQAAAFGIYLIMATQYPQINLMGGKSSASEVKQNTTHVLCGRVESSAAAANVLGRGDSGGELLQGYGDFLLKNSEGLTRLTVARLEKKHFDLLPRAETRETDFDEAPDHLNPSEKPGRPQDDFSPEEIGEAIFKLTSINSIKNNLKMGSSRAKRLHSIGSGVRQWAAGNGINQLPEDLK